MTLAHTLFASAASLALAASSTQPNCPIMTTQPIGEILTRQATDLFDVKAYGARCDGATDDSRAIQAALDAAGKIKGTGAVVLLGQGTCVIRSPIRVYSGTALAGRGIYSSNLSPGGGHLFDMIEVDGQNVEIRDFRVTDFSGVIHPRETFVVKDLTNGTNGGVSGLTLRNLQFERTVSGIYLRSGNVRAYDVRITGQKGKVGRGYVFDLGTNEVAEIDGGAIVDNDIGIDILSGSTFDMRDLEIMQNGTSLWAHPAADKAVFSIKTRNVWFDNSARYGLLLDGRAGSINRVDLFGSWFSSSGKDGIFADGMVRGLHVTGASIYANKGYGINLNGPLAKGGQPGGLPDMAGITITGSVISGSGRSGIRVGRGVTGFTLYGNTIGPGADFPGNGQYGVELEGMANAAFADSDENYVIVGNNLSGNKRASISDMSSTARKLFVNNQI